MGGGREQGWREGLEGGRGGAMGVHLADPARPAPVGRQERQAPAVQTSDHHHHLMAPERQQGTVCNACGLYYKLQCESPRPSPGTAAVLAGAAWAAGPSVAWPEKRAKGLPTRK